MNRPCRNVAESMGRPRSALGDAERLVLEQHLAECADCRRRADLSQLVRTMIREAPGGLDERARTRAMNAAFLRARQPAQAQPRRAVATRLTMAVAAAAVLLLGARALLERQPELAHVVPAASSVRDHSPVASTPTPAAEAEDWLAADRPLTRTFAHATVALAAGTRVRFHRASSTLELAAGELDVDVDASQGRPFAVTTQHFRAQVLGTQFTVTPERVSVRRGHVRVLDLSGAPLADLHETDVFTRAGQVSARTPEAARPGARESARSLLTRARSELSGGRVEAARELLRRAERVATKPRDLAEAGTLAAECALVARDNAGAIQAYLEVARRHAQLAAGENALFAAAQLSARGTDKPAARALLERYLQRYPAGRFADEARSRLVTLAR